MHRNYFLFEKQVFSLNKRLQSSTITECFAHRKDELVLLLESDERYHLRIGVNSQKPYILLDKAQSIKDPHVFLFKEINGKTVETLNIKPYDKIIDIQIEEFTLKCIFFGKGNNVFLVNSTDKIIKSFKKTDEASIQNLIDSSHKVFSPFDLDKIDRDKIQQNLSLFIMKSIGGFNKILSKELCFRANLDSSTLLSEINDREWNVLTKSIVNIMEEFKQENFFIYERKEGTPILSLIDLKHIPDDGTKTIYHDINMIWKQFSYISQQKKNLERVLNHGREKIVRRIQYLEKTLKKISDFKELDEKKKLSELKGHLLQTYSSEIKKGEEQVKLKKHLRC